MVWGLALYLFDPPMFLASPPFRQCPELSVPATKWGFPCRAPSLPLRLRHLLESSKAGDQATLDGIREGFTQASANRTSLPVPQRSELWPRHSWIPAGTPQGIPPQEHLETGRSGTSQGIFQWKHPPSSAFMWETIQAATACRSPLLPLPSIPTAVGTRSRCQDSSALHCPGQALTAATREEVWTPNKTGNTKETPEEVKRQTTGEINPPKYNASF